ncbi:hypothetical protein GCM10022271_07540 [Corallibacter vietnamensis]|uniref:Lipocalin-like domain-containing protein n=1 Tax=Corallibacter vietnamensis TaxID=904130 RepID=A0ABP7GYZ7_9FLAO
MKITLSLFTIIIHFLSVAQTKSIVGTYEMRLDSSNALVVDTLVLNNDGTFVYHVYDKHDGGIPPERNMYGKGTWKLENNIVFFKTTTSDIDKTHTLNFNNSKARFITKSPRDKTNREIPTSLRFFKSNIFWVKGRNLLKK